MRVLVTGSRTWDDHEFVECKLDDIMLANPGVILYHGACPTGADNIADTWARSRQKAGHNILVDRFPANWGNYGRAAGMVRNQVMVDAFGVGGSYAVLAFIRNGSKGASHCVKLARRAGLHVDIYRWDERDLMPIRATQRHRYPTERAHADDSCAVTIADICASRSLADPGRTARQLALFDETVVA